jgi:serine protease Do
MSVRKKLSVAAIVAVAFIAGIFFTTAGANFFSSDASVPTASQATPTFEGTTALSNPSTPAVADFETAFTQVAESVNPTVVQIRAQRVVEREMRRSPFEGTPFEDFFRPPGGQERQFRSQGLGSGVIIRPSGYIVTNNHVVDGADELSVVTQGNEEYDAEIVGTDEYSDLAVIRIEQSDLPSVSFGTNENVRPGQWVLAFGSPLSQDLENTVTAGIVSAVGRVSDATTGINAASELIQTDAAINPGNSGGPLMNLQGELIGINSAIFSQSGGYQGIGFAIPVDVVRNVTTQLIEQGEVQRGYLGVQFDRVSETLAQALGVPRGAAQVTMVQGGTPAEEAGLEQGDVIVAVDGQQLNNYNQLRTIISNKRPGDAISLRVVDQDGEERTVDVELDTRDDEALASNQNNGGESEEESSMESLGLTLQTVTPQMLRQLGIEDAEQFQGLMIADIDRGSDAYQDAGLRPRDIIVEVARERVRNREEFMQVYDDISSGENFLLRVVRVQGGQPTSRVTALTKP